MYATFPLFNTHLDLAHKQWRSIISPGDIVIDATCGNGHDSSILASLALTDSSGSLIAIDLQEEALLRARAKLAGELSPQQLKRVEFHLGCHSSFPEHIHTETVKLIAYNLGYLPGGDKSLTTTANTSIQSILHGMELVEKGGLISIACYPGHGAGKIEEEEILKFSNRLDPRTWSSSHIRWMNRRCSPTLLLLQKCI